MKKKNIASLLLAGLLGLSLCACGGQTAASSEAASSEESSAAATEAAATEAAAPTQAAAQETAEPVSAPDAEASVEVEDESPKPVVEYPLSDETLHFSIWMSNSPDLSDIVSDISDYTVFAGLEEATNVHLDATMVSFLASSEQFSLMVASEEYTDLVVKATDNYSGSVDQAIEEDFLIDLSPYIDADMPSLLGWFDKYPELRPQMTSVEGNIVAFPKIYKEKSNVTAGAMLRQDWLDDLGAEIPTSFDELHDLLVRFQSECGAATPLEISTANGVQSELISGYNINAGYYQVDGEVRFGPLQPEFKDYMQMMHDWLAEGLVSDSFLSQNADMSNLMDFSHVYNGEVGLWYGTNLQMADYIVMSSTEPDKMAITGLGSVTQDGSIAHLGEVGKVYDSNMWSMTTACDDPDTLCKYVDYIYSDAGVLLANYGIEGDTFVYDENGKPQLTEKVTNNPEYSLSVCLNLYTCDMQTPVPFVIDEEKTSANYSDNQKRCVEAWNGLTDGAYNMPQFGMSMTQDETTEYNGIYSDIETYMDENITKFIVGDRSLDEFDDFTQRLEDMGIQTCIDLTQAAYDRYMESMA